MDDDKEKKSLDFIRAVIEEDLESGKYGGRVSTRFPPEPNGYLHIGHAKSICLNFGAAGEYGGTCNLRFDDTNPTKEDTEFVESIIKDVRWLGFDWDDRLYHASDYFQPLYDYAVELIKKGKPLQGQTRPRKPRPLRAYEKGRIRGGRTRAPGEDRHVLGQHQHARPGHVQDTPGAPLQDGRRMAHLSDVRLRPLHIGLYRGDNAFALHARVRGPQTPIRLVPGRARHISPSADRIFAPQPKLHNHEQETAPGARAEGICQRMGRPQDAHDLGPDEEGRHPRIEKGILRP